MAIYFGGQQVKPYGMKAAYFNGMKVWEGAPPFYIRPDLGDPTPLQWGIIYDDGSMAPEPDKNWVMTQGMLLSESPKYVSIQINDADPSESNVSQLQYLRADGSFGKMSKDQLILGSGGQKMETPSMTIGGLRLCFMPGTGNWTAEIRTFDNSYEMVDHYSLTKADQPK